MVRDETNASITAGDGFLHRVEWSTAMGDGGVGFWIGSVSYLPSVVEGDVAVGLSALGLHR